MSEEAIFLAAIAIPDAEKRRIYLDRACERGSLLRKNIEALLNAHETDDPLDHPLTALDGLRMLDYQSLFDVGFRPEQTTELIAGRYRLKEPLGEGGMGSVYRAEQLTPVQRLVAVKLIRPGMDSLRVLARFEAERQALAVMDHPGIAKVLDAGLRTNGSPFFVMELVEGLTLTRYCDDRKLPVAERLTLFILVCKAVQHAHQKGIIHRDLKPSNILVAEVDGQPVAKVIDFGLAKALATGVLPDVTVEGMSSAFGTPLYMAPEQADYSADVDTRADVYALGAILYELLTGSTPIDVETLRTVPYGEMLRVIRDAEPPTPRERLANDDTLPEHAALRQIDPDRLKKLVRGDLEWVSMKCLEKERNRRYDTANALAMDLERYLANEPVTAAPPSRRYRAGKFIRRNRAAVIAAGLLGLMLFTGIAGTSFGLVEARRAAQAEKDANALTQKRLSQIATSNEILTAVFADLDVRAKRVNMPLEAILASRLVDASNKLDGEAIGDPLVLATMQARLGNSLHSLGYYRDSVSVLRKALAIRRAELGPDHHETLDCQMKLAISLRENGDFREALSLAEEVLSKWREALGPEHKDTLRAMRTLGLAHSALGNYPRAEELLSEVYRIQERTLSPNDPALLSAMTAFAKCYVSKGEPRKAVPLFETVLERERTIYGAGNLELMTTMSNLASAYSEFGEITKAAPLIEEAWMISRDRLGADHPEAMQCLSNLAVIRMMQRDFVAALPLCREAFRFNSLKMGQNHPHTLSALSDLAVCLNELGKLDEALPLQLQAVKLWEEKFGPTHREAILSKQQLANTYAKLEQFDKAAPLYQFVWENRKDQPMFFHSGRWLTNCHARLGNAAACVAAGKEVIAAMRLQNPARSPQLADNLEGIAYHYLMAGAHAEAQTLLEELVDIRDATSRDSAAHFITLALLARARAGSQDPAAEETLKAAYEGLVRHEKTLTGNRRAELAKLAEILIALYKAANKPEDVTKWEAELAKWKPLEKK